LDRTKLEVLVYGLKKEIASMFVNIVYKLQGADSNTSTTIY